MDTIRVTLNPVGGESVVTLHLMLADSFFGRLRGLLFRPALKAREGLMLTPCTGIHTFGMEGSIDVVFIDKGRRICGLAENLGPRKVRTAPGARNVIELWPGAITSLGLKVGDSVTW